MSKKPLLNSEQQAAVEHFEGPLLVLAGAGSGKTRIVTYRIAHLLDLGVPAQSIIAVTFTNKAAEEMRYRIQKLAHQQVLTCTFHSLCVRILRESIHHLEYNEDFIIYDDDDSEKLVKECLKTLGQKVDRGELKELRIAISQAKNNLLSPEEYSDGESTLLYAVYALYMKKLKTYNALDFDDLLYLTAKLFKNYSEVLEVYQKRWSFILIDEYQDTNQAQYLIAKSLSAKHHNIFAVGDPDQSIYSWRGANVDNILNFERDFPGAKVISLEQNYRSTNTILMAANQLIQHNERRFEKKLWSELGKGESIGLYICDNEHAEADFVVRKLLEIHRQENIPLIDCAVFYRTNFQSRTFEDAFLRHKIPYLIVGGVSFYQRKEIKDVLALMRVVLTGTDYISFARTLNIPKRGIGEATLLKINNLAEDEGAGLITTCQAILNGILAFKLSKKQRDGLNDYVSLVEAIKVMVNENLPLNEVFSLAIERWGYLNYLKQDPETYDERRANLDELTSKAAEWSTEQDQPILRTFLEELTLKSSAETTGNEEDYVKLMTLHNGKGLEFSSVFLVGMEEELFPHINARETPQGLEEERRLCYVGMTRAKKHLYMTASRFRFLWGTPRVMRPSRFLKEVPQEYFESHHITHKEEEEEDLHEEGFLIGDSVYHKDFGKGIVNRSYHTSLGLTYDVTFEGDSIQRSLVAKYAKLT